MNNMEQEYWKDIEGWEGKYQISTNKRVRKYFLKDGYRPVTIHKGFVFLSNGAGKDNSSRSVNKLYKIAFGTLTINQIKDNTRRGKEIIVFNHKGKFVGVFLTISSYLIKTFGKKNNLTNESLKKLDKQGYIKHNGYYVVIHKGNGLQHQAMIKSIISKQQRKKDKLQLEKRNKQILSNINLSIIITDDKFQPIELYIGTKKSLAEREGLPVGTLKAKFHKDIKVFKKHLDGSDHRTTSTKRFFNPDEYYNLVKEYTV